MNRDLENRRQRLYEHKKDMLDVEACIANIESNIAEKLRSVEGLFRE